MGGGEGGGKGQEGRSIGMRDGERVYHFRTCCKGFVVCGFRRDSISGGRDEFVRAGWQPRLAVVVVLERFVTFKQRRRTKEFAVGGYRCMCSVETLKPRSQRFSLLLETIFSLCLIITFHVIHILIY